MSLPIVQGIPIAVGQAVAQGVAVVEAVVVEAVNEVRDAAQVMADQLNFFLQGGRIPEGISGIPMAFPGRRIGFSIPETFEDVLFRYQIEQGLIRPPSLRRGPYQGG